MVLVTGGTGLVGSHLLFYLAQQEAPLRALYRSQNRIEKTADLFTLLGDADGSLFARIEWVHGELLDIPSLEVALENVEKVYHCAGKVSFDPADRKALYRNNVRATARLVDVCLMRGVRKILFVSSIAATGKEPDGGKTTEESPWNPAESFAYGQSKWEAEMEIWRGQQEGLETVVVNPGVILGTGFWDQGSELLFSRIYGGLKLYPPGETVLVSVDNLSRLMHHLMESDLVSKRFIVFQERWHYKKLFATIARGMKKRRPYTPIPKWSLGLLGSVDRIKAWLWDSERRLPPEVIKSLTQPTEYSTAALEELPLEFIPLEAEIEKNAALYVSYRKQKRRTKTS